MEIFQEDVSCIKETNNLNQSNQQLESNPAQYMGWFSPIFIDCMEGRDHFKFKPSMLR